ncbi:unnamed protein product, partial [Meganyctiphanes norvegica]
QVGTTGKKDNSSCPGHCRLKCLGQESENTSIGRKICIGKKICCTATAGEPMKGKIKQMNGKKIKVEKTISKKKQTIKESIESKKETKKAKQHSEIKRKSRIREKNKQKGKEKVGKGNNKRKVAILSNKAPGK